MKNTIIDKSIELLKKEGLKFSVDDLSAQLGISKKTVYKYFPDKESLAFAMYEKYYDVACGQVASVADHSNDVVFDLLALYLDSKTMTRAEIFNKYALNRSVSVFAMRKESELWDCMRPYLPACDDALKIIVDGALEKALSEGADCEKVIRRLVALW
ncbi:MAG: TetR/AcrR family transcriptional regulator [Christensenellales bacterium]